MKGQLFLVVVVENELDSEGEVKKSTPRTGINLVMAKDSQAAAVAYAAQNSYLFANDPDCMEVVVRPF